jgi:hypothetical protein
MRDLDALQPCLRFGKRFVIVSGELVAALIVAEVDFHAVQPNTVESAPKCPAFAP